MAAIRHYACQIAEKFDPDKIILFGSCAYGQRRLPMNSEPIARSLTPIKNRGDKNRFPLTQLERRGESDHV